MKLIYHTLLIAAVYFFVVMMYLIICEKQINLFMLGLQALTFGVIVAGFKIFLKQSKESVEQD